MKFVIFVTFCWFLGLNINRELKGKNMLKKILDGNYYQTNTQMNNFDKLGKTNLESCFMENEFVYYLSVDDNYEDEYISDESWMIF